MPEAPPAPAAPDLSGLDRAARINIAVAITQGATWERQVRVGLAPGWILREGVRHHIWIYDDARSITYTLPYYMGSWAACGPVMERERITLIAGIVATGEPMEWSAHHQHEVPDAVTEAPNRNPLEAVCLAVLRKYGVEVGK